MMFSTFDKKINRYSDVWKLYLLLRRIIEFSNSFIVKRSDLDQYHSDIQNYLEGFFNFEFHKNETFTYKMHYKRSFEIFGPLVYISTLRFERVQQKLKQFMKASKNHKNVSFSMTKSYLHYISTQKHEKDQIEKEIEEKC